MLNAQHPISTKVGTNFADKGRSLGLVHYRTQATEFYLFIYLFIAFRID
jgi:hypothetical protein